MLSTDPHTLTIDEARRIVGPLYDALNRPAEKDVSALLTQACHDDYQSYHTNQDWLTRDQLAETFKGFGQAIPDLSWDIEEIHVLGDQVFVRGNAKGTPTAELFGVAPSGKSFRTMALDIFTVRDGKLAKAYHVENWTTAVQQVTA